MLKSHYAPTYERAKVVTKASPGITAYGAITLNHSVGGLNPVALEIAGRSGNKIVWMPTVDAANETAGRSDGPTDKLPFWAKIQRELSATGISPAPISVLDGGGKVSDAARRCLELIGKHDMILATGHLSKKEIHALVKTAKGNGSEARPRNARRIPVAEHDRAGASRSGRPRRHDRALLHHHVHE